MSTSPEYVLFDIETRPLPELVDKYAKPFPDFDPAAIKCGNLKDPAKIAEKMAQAKADHEADRVAYWKNLKDNAALDPFTGAVVCIGVCADNGVSTIIAEATEADTLRAFWSLWEQRDCVVTRFVFWSGCGDVSKHFDIDYIVTRSRLNRVKVPAGVRSGRYYSNRIVDLAKEFLLYQRERYLSLTKAAAMFGLYDDHKDLVPKADSDVVTGATFYQWWDGTASNDQSAETQRDLARLYLLNDVRTLRALTPYILC